MRIILIAIVALLVGCGLLIGNESRANQATQYASQTFTITRQGTLLELIDADGRGRKKVTGDGFKLNYKTRGKSRSASAIGTKTKQLRTSSEPAKFDGNTVTVIVQTADKALEITSRLTFDPKTRELIIKRKFRNISEYPVILESIRNYIDQKLVRDQFNQSADLASLIRAGLYDDCDNLCAECTAPPICEESRLPIRNSCRFSRARLCPPKTNFVLEWSEQNTLKPLLPHQPGGERSIDIRALIR